MLGAGSLRYRTIVDQEQSPADLNSQGDKDQVELWKTNRFLIRHPLTLETEDSNKR